MTAFIYLVRHGEVAHHRADVSLTDEGRAQAEATGAAFASRVSEGEAVFIRYSPVVRVQQTAELMHAGLSATLHRRCQAGKVVLHSPKPDSALRNPGFALQAGEPSVEPSRLYTQTSDPTVLSTLPPAKAEFYRGFWIAADNMGYWLTHDSSGGMETPTVVLDRLHKRLREIFTEESSHTKRSHWLMVTHSGPMRALLRKALGDDPGEPEFCEVIGLKPTQDLDRASVWYRGQHIFLEL